MRASGRAEMPRRRGLLALLTAFVLALGWIVLGSPSAAADGPTTFSNTTSIAVPATGSANQIGQASPYPSNVSVSGMTGLVTNVTVVLHNVTHSAFNDIDVLLVAPDGENLIVVSDVGDPSPPTFPNAQLVTASNVDLTFADSATGPVPRQVVLPTGTYKPTNQGSSSDTFPAPAPTPSSQTTLAGAFTGSNPNGTWSLYVVDDTSGDLGSIAGGWSLSLTTETAAVSTTTTVASSDSTSFTGDAVTFTATVSAGGSAVTSGTVQFADGSTNLGAPVPLNGSGTARVTTSALTEGTHTIVATYSGATGFLGSNGSVDQRVDNKTVVTGQTYCNTGPIDIPSQGKAVPYPSNIFVSGLSGQVTKITATLKGLSHASPTDLDIMLSGPTPAKNLLLLSDPAQNNISPAVSNLNLTFDDAAASGLPNPLVSGTFKPTDNDPDGQVDSFPGPAPAPSSATTLSTFNGASANGTWSLWVFDDASADAGSIANGWCLTITSQSPTTTALTSSENPSVAGESVTFTSTVTSGGSPVTTGSVQFTDNGADLGAPVPVSASGVATYTSSNLSVGTHPIRATYLGTSTLGESHADLDQVVNLIPTTTALTSSLNPSHVGDEVVFTATVTDVDGDPVTAGTVQFADGGTDLGSAVPIAAGGIATVSTTSLTAGTHPITATYSGTATLATSDGDLNQQVTKVETATALTVSDNPSLVGQSITFTARVTAGTAPVDAGQVQFSDGATPLGGPVNLDADGTATLIIDTLAAGSHAITAAYLGTDRYSISDKSVTQVVNKTGTSTSLASDRNPSTVGADVTFTATVTAGGAPATGGSVQFTIDGSNFGAPVPLNGSGVATLTTNALAAGTHSIGAAYSGTDALDSGDPASLSQVVELVETTATLSSSTDPSIPGQQVSITASVLAGAVPVADGTVQFSIDGTPVGAPVALTAGGTAVLDHTFATAGTYVITAAYSGTTTYAESQAQPLDQHVAKVVTAGQLTLPATSTVGDPVTITMTVSGTPTPTGGTVQFTVDGDPLGAPVPLTAGVATVNTSGLPVGTHTITGTYTGTDVFTGTSADGSITVGQVETAVALASSSNPSTYGDDLTFTATVTRVAGGAPVTEGEVGFVVDGLPFGTGTYPVAADGTASITSDQLAGGAHTVSARYVGTTDYAPSVSADLVQRVNTAASSVVLTSSGSPSNFGESVTFTATVTGPGSTPTGTVAFSIDGTVVEAGAALDANGRATYTTSALAAGPHAVVAEYSGSDSYQSSTSNTVSQTVVLLVAAGGPYDIAEGQGVTLDGTGSSPGADTYAWDLNYDGTTFVPDVIGPTPELSWKDLQSFGINDGLATATPYAVALRVTSGTETKLSITTIFVTNTAPTAVVTGSLIATVGVPFTVKVGADDPSSADLAADFTYTVDWGDGSPVESVVGPADPPVTHTYTTAGTYSAVFSATDKDGGEGGDTTVAVVTAPAEESASPTSTATSTSDDDSLASTGSSVSLTQLALGGALLIAGASLLLLARRRRTVHGSHE